MVIFGELQNESPRCIRSTSRITFRFVFILQILLHLILSFTLSCFQPMHFEYTKFLQDQSEMTEEVNKAVRPLLCRMPSVETVATRLGDLYAYVACLIDLRPTKQETNLRKGGSLKGIIWWRYSCRLGWRSLTAGNHWRHCISNGIGTLSSHVFFKSFFPYRCF